MLIRKLLILLVPFYFLLSCTGDDLVPVKGPEGDPSLELNFSQFDDIPIRPSCHAASLPANPPPTIATFLFVI